ncbi:MAG: RNA polymerase sigma factor [bacterium]
MRRAVPNLVQRMLEGDSASFHDILDLYSGDVLRLCCALLWDDEEAKDVLQEAMFRLVRSVKRGRFRESDGSIKGFLMITARNLCVDRLKKRVDLRSLEEDESSTPTALCETHTPDRAADENRLRLVFDHALGELTDAQRAVLVLRDLKGENHRDIAEALHISVDSAKALLYRARRKMRFLLKPYMDQS